MNTSEKAPALPWGVYLSLWKAREPEAGALIREKPKAWGVEGQSGDLWGWGHCPGPHCQDWCQVWPSLIWEEYREVYFGLRVVKQQEPPPNRPAGCGAAKQLTWGAASPSLGGLGKCSVLLLSTLGATAPRRQWGRPCIVHLWRSSEAFLRVTWPKRGKSAAWFPVCSMK